MILEKFCLDKKVAIITGAYGGIGRGISIGLMEAGSDLVLVGRNDSLLKRFAAKLKKINGNRKILTIKADVTNAIEIDLVVKRTMEVFKKIDILVNNAGINLRAKAEEFTEENWDRVINTNLKGTFLFTQAVGKIMIKQKYGKIINISSLASVIAGENTPAYAASKGGVSQLTKAFAVAWAKYNINVNAIGPGFFKTKMTKTLYEDKVGVKKILNHTPMKRWGDIEKDIAGSIVFLSSEASNFITAQTIYVDGGYLAY